VAAAQGALGQRNSGRAASIPYPRSRFRAWISRPPTTTRRISVLEKEMMQFVVRAQSERD